MKTSKILLGALTEALSEVYIGEPSTIEALWVAVLASGHVLLEGRPGLAKTTLAKGLAQCISADFKRIQFTMDLLPADITGSMVYRLQEARFDFVAGPIFANLVLADELNRAPAKTQSALLEAMQEGQVSIENQSHRLPRPFIVIATQNSEDDLGTYPLPDSQLDRFLFRLQLEYPSYQEELEIVRGSRLESPELRPILTSAELLAQMQAVESVQVHERVLRYIVHLIRATRQLSGVERGASPRAGVALMRATKARALVHGRNYALPDDVQWAFPLVLNHRLLLGESSLSINSLLATILREIPFE